MLAVGFGPRTGYPRAAAERGRLKAQKTANGTWLSSRNWVDDYQRSRYKRTPKS